MHWRRDGKELYYLALDRSVMAAEVSTSPTLRIGTPRAALKSRCFRYTPGAGLQLTDWSTDGKLMVSQDDCSGVLMLLRLNDPAKPLERKAIDWLRDEFSVRQARFSPDMRFVAYLSDEIVAETFELYVRPFDAKRPEAGAGDTTPVRLSNGGASGVVGWREDGKELYYLTPDGGVMSLEIASNGSAAAAPRRLFSLSPQELPLGEQWNNASRDGSDSCFPLRCPPASPRGSDRGVFRRQRRHFPTNITSGTSLLRRHHWCRWAHMLDIPFTEAVKYISRWGS